MLSFSGQHHENRTESARHDWNGVFGVHGYAAGGIPAPVAPFALAKLAELVEAG
jgi:hypothetical protein